MPSFGSGSETGLRRCPEERGGAPTCPAHRLVPAASSFIARDLPPLLEKMLIAPVENTLGYRFGF